MLKEKIKYYLFNFTQTQLIATLVSIPILVGWGLQISLISFIGNLIFTPILTVFLLLSSVIFFTELLGIPNSLVIKSLEALTNFWQNTLALGKKEWLISFCHPTTLILFLIPALVFLTLLLVKHKKPFYKMVLMLVCLACSVLFLAILPKFFNKTQNTTDFYNQKLIFKFDNQNNATLVDNGYFSTKASPEKIIDYEIKQYLIKNTGKPEIKNIILLKPGLRTFRAAQELCNKLDVKSVTLPLSNKKLTKKACQEFYKLKELLQEKNISLNQAHHLKAVEQFGLAKA
jgi:hypothetical protein